MAESLRSPLRVVPIAIVGKTCLSSRLCSWNDVLSVELLVEPVGLVWHSVLIVVGVVRLVATISAVRVGSTVVVVAIGRSTAWAVQRRLNVLMGPFLEHVA